MAIFEEEPGDIPPAPWEYQPELPPEIEQGENRPVPEDTDDKQPPEPEVPPEDKYGPPPQIADGDGELPPPKQPVDPNDWTQSERALQEKWIPQTNPRPLPPPYSTDYGPAGEQYGFFPQQSGMPESMFQQGKGWRPTPLFHETTTFTPGGYAETTTSPSNWLIPRSQRVTGPKMPIQSRNGRGGGYGPSGDMTAEEYIRYLENRLKFGGLLRL